MVMRRQNLIWAGSSRVGAPQVREYAGGTPAPEAGYEQAVYWMSQQPDMLSALYANASGTAGSLTFDDASCDYRIGIFTFLKHRPIYRVLANGQSGVFNRTVDVFVIQAMSGWDMGMCRVPYGSTSTSPVNFAGGA